MENLFALTFSKNRVNEMSSLGLAHIGDGVYELLCRSYLCAQGDHTVKNLHRDTIAMVNASRQAAYARKLLPLLSEEEQGFFRRGKNAHTHAAPKAASKEDYALATGLEALFGALWLMGRTQRLNELFAAVVCTDGKEEMYGI